MKRGLKVTLIIVAVIVVLLLAISLLASPIMHWYIEKHSKELIGRKITIENMDIRLLLGRAAIDDFVLYESNDVDTFVSIKHVDADMRVWGILRNSIVVDSINIVAPNITVIREGNSLNFDDILSFLASKSGQDTTETSSNGMNILLQDIALENGVIRYADDVLDIDWVMNHIKLNIPEFDLSGSGTRAQLYLDFARGGSMTLNAMFNQSNMDYDLGCKITDYPLGVLMPFIDKMVNVGAVNGSLYIDLHANGNIENIMASSLDGIIEINNATVKNKNEKELLSLAQLRTDIEHLDIARDYNVKLRELRIDGITTGFEIFKDGSNNFSSLFAVNDTTTSTEQDVMDIAETEQQSDSAEYEPQLNLVINNLSLNNGHFTFTDHTLPEPFSLRLSKMHFKSPNFTMQGHNSIELFSVLQEVGMLRVKWDGNIEAQEHDLSIFVNNLNLKELSPYSLAYFGYPISDGKLSFRGQNIISGGNLRGANKLSLYHPTVDKKRKDIDPAYGMVPLKLAIVVLTDREGKAEIDLPISGNIHSPQFSYSKIIVQALINVLVKIAAAPIDLIADALGLNNGEIKEIEFGAWQFSFTPEQYDKIEKLAQIVSEKPELAVQLIHEVNYKDGIQAIVEHDARRDYYLHIHPERAQSLNMVDVDTYQKISLKNPQLIQFVDSMLVVRNLSTSGNFNDKIHLLYGDGAMNRLMRNVEMRNRGVAAHWSRMLNMPDSTLHITTPTAEEIEQHTGKTRFKVELTTRDDVSPEVQPATSDSIPPVSQSPL